MAQWIRPRVDLDWTKCKFLLVTLCNPSHKNTLFLRSASIRLEERNYGRGALTRPQTSYYANLNLENL
uniref:Uncharacterized protein n=1 Tax=Parascaris equorum TaxID=6256 RepID=A0A914RSY9_PAREQ